MVESIKIENKIFVDLTPAYIRIGLLSKDYLKFKSKDLIETFKSFKILENDYINLKNNDKDEINNENLDIKSSELIDDMNSFHLLTLENQVKSLKKHKTNYINRALSYTSKNSNYSLAIILILKTNYEEFKSSDEYQMVVEDFGNIKIIEYSGVFDEKSKNMLLEYFPNIEIFNKSLKSVNLSVLGIEYLMKNFKNSKIFFKLPFRHLKELQTVGNVNKLNYFDKIYVQLDESIYPYCISSMIEGSSTYKVIDKDKVERLGGSSIGLTTYWSLVKLICGYDNPLDAVLDAIQGDNSNIDLSVGDIFGGNYEGRDLPEKLIASSFGKIKRLKQEDVDNLKKQDISRSLLTFTCLCNGQIISMLAQIENLKTCLVYGNPFEFYDYLQLMQMIIRYNSKDKVDVIFCDYNSYLTILGMVSIYTAMNK